MIYSEEATSCVLLILRLRLLGTSLENREASRELYKAILELHLQPKATMPVDAPEDLVGIAPAPFNIPIGCMCNLKYLASELNGALLCPVLAAAGVGQTFND